ncbi:hypothetical protein HWI79_1534 [Cryptosporidium felis]|nr:hypothetical protein HWI79_1534 [Cryptosporidium felis]
MKHKGSVYNKKVLRKTYRYYFLIFSILVLVTSLCKSSDLGLQNIQGNFIEDAPREQVATGELPRKHLDEYGYYFLSDHLQSTNLIHCEDDNKYLEEEYGRVSSVLVVVASKLLLNLQEINMIMNTSFREIATKIFSLDSLISNLKFFLAINNMYELSTSNTSPGFTEFITENLKLEVEGAIEMTKEILNRLGALSSINEEDLFCKHFYFFRFKGLLQSFIVVKGLLLTMQGEEINTLMPQLDNTFTKVFDVIIGLKDQFRGYGALISEVNNRLLQSLLYCLNIVQELDLPIFGGDGSDNSFPNTLPGLFASSFGKRNSRSAYEFGVALDELFLSHIFSRRQCEVQMNDLKQYISSLLAITRKNLAIINVLIQKLGNIQVEKIIKENKYALFDSHRNGLDKEQLYQKMGDQIISESMRGCLLIISEFSAQLRVNYEGLVELSQFSTPVSAKITKWEAHFPNLIRNKDKAKSREARYLSNLIDIVIKNIRKINFLENKALNVLNFNIFFDELEKMGMKSESSFLRSIIGKIQTALRLNRIEFSLVSFSESNQGGDSTSDVLNPREFALDKNDEYQQNCGALGEFAMKKASSDPFWTLLSQVDLLINSAIRKFRLKSKNFSENMTSLKTLMSVITGHDQASIVSELIQAFLLDGSYFEEKVGEYNQIRNCIGGKRFGFSPTDFSVETDSIDLRKYKKTAYLLTSDKLSLLNKLLENYDLHILNELVQAAESLLDVHLLSQVYLSGSTSQVLRSKIKGDGSFSDEDLEFIYRTLIRDENRIFTKKNISSVAYKDPRGKLLTIYSLLNSYLKQLVSFEEFLKQWDFIHVFDDSGSDSNYAIEFLETINTDFDILVGSLIEMFELGLLTARIERDVLNIIGEYSDRIITSESKKILKKVQSMFEIRNLISTITRGSSYNRSKLLFGEVEARLGLSDNIQGESRKGLDNWGMQLDANDFPGSIKLNKRNVIFSDSNLGSGCTVAYLDRDSSLLASKEDGLGSFYNVVVMHCKITNKPGETINDFLKRRGLIKQSGAVALPQNMEKYLEETFSLSYLAIDPALSNSIVFVSRLESELNQLFALLPEVTTEYFLNLDLILISGPKVTLEMNRNELKRILIEFISLDSELNSGSGSLSFLSLSKLLFSEFPTDKEGNIIKLQSIGKYSGFGGDTPISASFIRDHQLTRGNTSVLDDLRVGLFQKCTSSYLQIYKNFAPLRSSQGSGREFIWIVNERSNILYMLKLRDELEEANLSESEPNSIYAAAGDAQYQLQISSMNILFNSIVKRKGMNNVFYDVTKGKLVFLINEQYDLDSFRSLSKNLDLGLKQTMFKNTVISPSYILDVPVYEAEMIQIVDFFISNSMPHYCFSRRNFYDNSIILNLNDHFSLQEVISYRLLLHTINPSINLRVRNLPSQSALRKILNFGSDFIFDLNKLALSYISTVGIGDDALASVQRYSLAALERSIRSSQYRQLSKFTVSIDSNSVGYSIVKPTPNYNNRMNSNYEKIILNGEAYLLIKYSPKTLISSLSSYVDEVFNGRLNIIFSKEGLDLSKISPSDIPFDGNVHMLHLLKHAPIELIPEEHLIRIHAYSYETEDLQLVTGIMSIYRGYNLSIVTRHREFYYFNKLCWDTSTNAPKQCSYVRVFRYLRTSLFEKLKLYQMALNNNAFLSTIGEEKEILSLDDVGLNAVSRFGGSVLFKAEDFYEVYYESGQYWNVCSFVQEFFKSAPGHPVKAINFDANIKEIVFKPDNFECPVPPIPNFCQEDLPHFVACDVSQASLYRFTYIESIRYEVLLSFLNFFLSGKKATIKPEGSDRNLNLESVSEILEFFNIKITDGPTQSIIKLDNVSFKISEFESAAAIASQLRALFPSAVIIGLNPRGEVVV